ncbi:helicase-like transcription factor CHR28 isoform X2 [Hevea brasiliensis]|uniref:helicase-like transcription factor CHR28 isoform X2 n=1 Tax=Hevea brasiliensis TaxID=3981 RepID=UPI0025D053E3|nr:helicase-like transcription factor CHR28 isoform X2 [Hevea brasiliensis]
MMIMADGGSGPWPCGDISGVDEVDGGNSGGNLELTMDMDDFLHILEEPGDPSQSSPEEFSSKNLKNESATDVDVGNHKNFQLQSGFQMLNGRHALESESINPATFYPSHNPEASDARIRGSFGSFDHAGISAMAFNHVTLDPSSQISSPMHACPVSPKEWCCPCSRDQGEGRVGVLQPEIPNASHGLYMNTSHEKFGHSGAFIEKPEIDLYRSMDMSFVDADVSSHNLVSSQSTFCHHSDDNTELGAHFPAMQFGVNADNTFFLDSPECYFVEDFSFELLPSNEVITTNKNDEIREFQTESSCSVSEISVIDYSDVKGLNFKSEAANCISRISSSFSSNTDDRFVDNKSSGVPFSCIQSTICKKQLAAVEDGKIDEVVACRSMISHSDEISNEAVNRKFSCSDESGLFVDEESKQSSSGVSSSVWSQNHFIYVNDEKGDVNVASMRAQFDGIAGKIPLGAHLKLNASDHYFSHVEEPNVNKQLSFVKEERDSKLIQPECLGHLSSVSPESIQSNLSGSKSNVDDGTDLCVLEDISHPVRINQSVAVGKANGPTQHSAYGNSVHCTGIGSTRLRANDERFIFRAALQDISQPKSEASPPEGVLVVPLLRHQRIALSWMIQKETSMYCSGGILADDQGLGKTVSTIALILKERPPSVKVDPQLVKKEVFEPLDLDEDDDEVTEVYGMKKDAQSFQLMSNQSSKKSMNSYGQSTGRPSAGTLVVCPTSVLRQWAEELDKKVNSKANLSVLVYHGSNRTKDPCELAKYDVVLTTYSIVSMEVPKQPLVDEDDDEIGKGEGDDGASLGLSFGKKRKYPPSSGKKGSRNKKGMDAALLESVARPLAKVAWFRVVLDEAQSIKNHRTQVARACWGLRAKRRWCLSGTPIQNAIDDLYSYFRFLRYDPYDVYTLFCSTIKIPIQKNPTKGYKKLQAVLKAIMLRRTKGTNIDGKPIITLPPKVVELKKVDFTDEERDFYTRLEIDSRAQFKEYAAAGTVKQNYVNILLMLLRLRQACDHPLLIRGLDSISFGKSSIEMAKKLPREKQMCLWNCLEASLAICGICNDPPEDAVVSICGHVFCNQCICEHLTGDDNQCPASKCNVRLNKSSVFSKSTLNSSLSDQPAQDGSGFELGRATNPYSEGCPHDSSKIRAALEVLLSLTKPGDCASTNGSLENSFDGNAGCHENLCSSGNSVNDNTDKRNLLLDENVNGSVKVVGEKALVFSQWTRMLDLLETCLKNCSIQYRRLDGTMSVVARDRAVKDFNTLPEVSVMIMSLKAASLGLNMVAACRVLLLDLWWNPTTEDQAIDRAHRIGQTRPVTVLRLTVKDTVEDRILALQQKKREMVSSAFGEDENGGRQTRLTVEDLNYLFMA